MQALPRNLPRDPGRNSPALARYRAPALHDEHLPLRLLHSQARASFHLRIAEIHEAGKRASRLLAMAEPAGGRTLLAYGAPLLQREQEPARPGLLEKAPPYGLPRPEVPPRLQR
jgi:hypothetical protein